MKQREFQGYAYGAMSGICYGLIPVLVLSLVKQGMDVLSILFFKSIFSFISIGLACYTNKRIHVQVGLLRILPICVLGILLAGTMFLAYTGFKLVDIGPAATVVYLYPIFEVLIMSAFFYEKLSLASFLCIMGAMLGFFLMGAFAGGVVQLSGLLMLMSSAALFALYVVGVNTGDVKNVTLRVVAFWTALSSMALFVFMVFMRESLAVPHSPVMWVELLALALVPTFMTYQFTSRSVERIGTRRCAVAGVTDPIFATICGILIYNQDLSARELLGMVIILISVCVTIYSGIRGRRLLATSQIAKMVQRRVKKKQ